MRRCGVEINSDDIKSQEEKLEENLSWRDIVKVGGVIDNTEGEPYIRLRVVIRLLVTKVVRRLTNNR
jgi:hypothetical protein